MEASFHVGNRRTLYKTLENRSVCLVFSGHAPLKTGDEFYPFFAERNFVYLTGLTAQGFILMAVKDAQGNPYTIPGYAGTYQEMNNPLAMLSLPATKGWTHKITPNFSIDLQLWDNLRYHFNYGADLSFYGNHGYTLIPYILSGNNRSDHTSASTYKGNNYTWQVENTLSYDKTIGDHSFAVVLGQSALKSGGDDVNYGAWGIVNPSKPYLNYLNGIDEVVLDPETGLIKSYTKSNWGGGGEYEEHTMASYFGRLSYNYADVI